MNAQKQININKRVLFAKMLAVITKHWHWQQTYSDHCFVEAQLRQHTNRLFDGLDPRFPRVDNHQRADPVNQIFLDLVDPRLVPLPLEVERNANFQGPSVTLEMPPLTPPESLVSWDMMSNSPSSSGSCSSMSEHGYAANTAAPRSALSSDKGKGLASFQREDEIHHYPVMGPEEPHDQVFYPDPPLEEAPYHVQLPELDPGHNQNPDLTQNDERVWQLQMQFVFRGELVEVWNWFIDRGPILHPSHISLQLQLAMIRQLENTISPPTNAQLRDFEAEADHNLALMTKEVASLELLIYKMSRILYELERGDRNPFLEPISVVLLG
ncbi:hypothetical protein QBC40DRAFT_280241 [Triangularia verruculosa]|uniref:Uncharacterized protein n=1 Tax=Triangularia verruculosa TaxID=2587418 RepID=A0AAN6XM48_9PEZI|nr:hypothetical protein QBC40DRAFT_280241 [Triangularia verruculosa]